jgi:hypothetical protein
MGAVTKVNIISRSRLLIALVATCALLGAYALTQTARPGSAGDEVVLSDAYASLVESAPSTQVAALADMRIDRAEYVTAIEAERACLRAQGIEPSEAEWNLMGQLSYSVGPFPDRASMAPAEAIYRACHEEHAANIQAAWATGAAPKTSPFE